MNVMIFSDNVTVEDEVVLTVNVTTMPGVLLRKGTVALPGAIITTDTTNDSLHFGPRRSPSDSSNRITMPDSEGKAYPWILRFGESRYPAADLKSQREQRH